MDKHAFVTGFQQRWVQLVKQAWAPTAIGAGLGALAGAGLGYYLSDPEGDSRSTLRNTVMGGVGGGLLGLGAGLGTNDFSALRQWTSLQLEGIAQAVRSGHGDSPTIRAKLDELSKQPLTPGERQLVQNLRETGGPPQKHDPMDEQVALQERWQDALTQKELDDDIRQQRTQGTPEERLGLLPRELGMKPAPVGGNFQPFPGERAPFERPPGLQGPFLPDGRFAPSPFGAR